MQTSTYELWNYDTVKKRVIVGGGHKGLLPVLILVDLGFKVASLDVFESAALEINSGAIPFVANSVKNLLTGT
jgi:hypothetical protein